MTSLTDWVLATVVVLLVLYDLAVVVSIGPEATISRRALHWSLQCPLLPFAVGVLIGHLFCPQVVRLR